MEGELHRGLLERAGDLLRRRAYSRGELAARLSNFGNPVQIEKTLDRLQELDLLNDPRYAYNFALHRLTETGWGPRKVREALHVRKLATELVESVLDRISREIGFQPIMENYLEKHCRKSGLPSDRKGIHRILQHLRRRGFSEEDIYSVLRQKIPGDAWLRFETGE